jgi:hypothetical protein
VTEPGWCGPHTAGSNPVAQNVDSTPEPAPAIRLRAHGNTQCATGWRGPRRTSVMVVTMAKTHSPASCASEPPRLHMSPSMATVKLVASMYDEFSPPMMQHAIERSENSSILAEVSKYCTASAVCCSRAESTESDMVPSSRGSRTPTDPLTRAMQGAMKNHNRGYRICKLFIRLLQHHLLLVDALFARRLCL